MENVCILGTQSCQSYADIIQKVMPEDFAKVIPISCQFYANNGANIMLELCQSQANLCSSTEKTLFLNLLAKHFAKSFARLSQSLFAWPLGARGVCVHIVSLFMDMFIVALTH